MGRFLFGFREQLWKEIMGFILKLCMTSPHAAFLRTMGVEALEHEKNALEDDDDDDSEDDLQAWILGLFKPNINQRNHKAINLLLLLRGGTTDTN